MTKQLNLGELIRLLEAQPPTNTVTFDFCGRVPDRLDSYRGFYDQLALGWRECEMKEVHVSDLLEALYGALGNVFTGYKGGKCEMSLATPLWVANRGEADGTVIVGLADCDYMTIIETRWIPC